MLNSNLLQVLTAYFYTILKQFEYEKNMPETRYRIKSRLLEEINKDERFVDKTVGRLFEIQQDPENPNNVVLVIKENKKSCICEDFYNPSCESDHDYDMPNWY